MSVHSCGSRCKAAGQCIGDEPESDDETAEFYLLLCIIDIETEMPLGIYSTPEKAQEALAIVKRKDSLEEYVIVPFPLDALPTMAHYDKAKMLLKG